MAIRFATEGLTFEVPRARLHVRWLIQIAETRGQRIAELTYIFCSDEYLLSLNQEYLEHDTLTDILTFPYQAEGEPLHSDIFISVDRVMENALEFREPFEQELRRVMAHGLLHLLGEDDHGAEAEASMRASEQACLSLFEEMA